DYYKKADDEVLIVLQCEHIAAVENADSIFSVPGIDAIFVGPNDLAASMRGKDGRPPSGQATTAANKQILATCKKHGVAAGYHCSSPEEVLARMEEGWQFLGMASELKLMLDRAAAVVKAIGCGPEGELARY